MSVAAVVIRMHCRVAAIAAASLSCAQAACITLSVFGDGTPLAALPLADDAHAFRIAYVHSVTLTPVEERYEAHGDRIVQTEIRFVAHGPGLPTAADDGGAFDVRDGAFVVRGHREFGSLVMRVDAAQRPTLATESRSIDLAHWGRRALALAVSAGACASDPPM